MGDEPVPYIPLISSITAGLPPLPIAEMGAPSLAQPAVALNQARVMIVTSAGVRHRDDPSFQPTNDLSFRTIAADTDVADLVPSHPTPVRRPAEADVNCVFPITRLHELVAEGRVGAVTSLHLSFLGTIKRLRELVTDLAPAMARVARQERADAVLFVPL